MSTRDLEAENAKLRAEVKRLRRTLEDVRNGDCEDVNGPCGECGDCIIDAALSPETPAGAGETTEQPWGPEDKPLPEDPAIHAAHPLRTGNHKRYAEALRLVGAKHSKYALVDLVNWLLGRIEPPPVAEKGKEAKGLRLAWIPEHPSRPLYRAKVPTQEGKLGEVLNLLTADPNSALQFGTELECRAWIEANPEPPFVAREHGFVAPPPCNNLYHGQGPHEPMSSCRRNDEPEAPPASETCARCKELEARIAEAKKYADQMDCSEICGSHPGVLCECGLVALQRVLRGP